MWWLSEFWLCRLIINIQNQSRIQKCIRFTSSYVIWTQSVLAGCKTTIGKDFIICTCVRIQTFCDKIFFKIDLVHWVILPFTRRAQLILEIISTMLHWDSAIVKLGYNQGLRIVVLLVCFFSPNPIEIWMQFKWANHKKVQRLIWKDKKLVWSYLYFGVKNEKWCALCGEKLLSQ